MATTCEGCGKAEAAQQCPTCRQLGLLPPSRYCDQACFKSSWKQHKATRHQPAERALAEEQFYLDVKQAGDGQTRPKKGDTIVMSYVGMLTDGRVFDSNESFQTQIGVGRLIRGWDEAVVRMTVGEKAQLVIRPEKGYGARGVPPAIPPNATLVFDIQLKAVL
eukprot:TRINITY_DN5137_c0_g1_i1.p3 TRINITY_DN5137_c0_g1~~TRINITY_DN5137_c0_g1_i1.p3  ORF type:complete len:163 (+),score=33.22 TRINITY_DN5137_c0_g1_i1:96-584(+)